MNGKPDSGSPQFTSKVPGLAKGGMSSPDNKLTGGKVPGVSGDSSGKCNTTKNATASPGGGHEGSPYASGGTGATASGPERMPITGMGN